MRHGFFFSKCLNTLLGYGEKALLLKSKIRQKSRRKTIWKQTQQ